MKKLVLLFAIAIFAVGASAQQRQKPTAESKAMKQTEAMVEKLGLSEAQKQKIYEINLQYIQPIKVERSQNIDREKLKAEFEAQQKEKDAAIKLVLNEEQQAKYDAWHKEKPKMTKGGARKDARK